MHPHIWRIGDSDVLVLSSYGVLVAVGFLLSLWVARRLAARAGLPPDRVSDLVIWSLLAGLLGSKLSLVLLDLPAYIRQPSLILGTIRYAGVFYGGFLVGLLVVVLWCRRARIPFGKVADVLAPPLALAHAFGRVGCLAAGCCFGTPTSAPWGVVFTDPAARETVGTPLGVALHPVQLYEGATNLLLFLLLLWLFGRRRFDGMVAASYVLLYAATRFLWEFFRADERGALGPLSTSQWLALLAAAGTGVFLLRRALRRPAPPDPRP
jgi:phosphatidylglycerol:prolipoprotein diacylglycerol transferase